MKTKNFLFLTLFFYSTHLFSQGRVGINTNDPQASLHVTGNVRIDSIPFLDTVVIKKYYPLFSDSLGNILKLNDRSPNGVSILEYGEVINSGDVVVIGDGLTSYRFANQDASGLSNVTVPMGNLICQTFTTSSDVLKIRSILFRSSMAQTTFTLSLKACTAGIPAGPDLGVAVFSHTATYTNIQMMLVFPIPIPVQPNTQYAFIIDFVKPGTPSANFYCSNSDLYTGGMRLQSVDNGLTWTSFPSSDLFFSSFEVQTEPGKVYKTKLGLENETIDAGIVNGYMLYNDTHINKGDKIDNFYGVALESGIKGDQKQVAGGYVCNGFNNLITGLVYYLDGIPGKLSTTPYTIPILDRKIGFAFNPATLIITK